MDDAKHRASGAGRPMALHDGQSEQYAAEADGFLCDVLHIQGKPRRQYPAGIGVRPRGTGIIDVSGVGVGAS